MAKIAQAYVEITARTGKLKQQLRGAVQASKRAAAAMRAAFRGIAIAIAAASAAVIFLVKRFAEQDRATRKIRGVLRAWGDDVETSSAFLHEQATAIQRVTDVGDEQLLTMFAQMRALGAQVRDIPTLTKATLGLANAIGLNNQAAARYIVLAQQGETTMLQRYIPALRFAKDEQEKFRIVMDAGRKGYQAFTEESKGLEVAFKQITNASGDFLQALGKILVPGGFEQLLRNMALAVSVMAEGLADAAGDIRVLIRLFAELSKEIALLPTPFGKLAAAEGAGAAVAAQFTVILRKFQKAILGGITSNAFGGVDFAGAGGGSRGIISSIQTAIGGFKTGQNPALAVAKAQLTEDQEQTAALKNIDRNTRNLGPSE